MISWRYHRTMKQVLIRNLDDALLADYRAAAAHNQRSLEAELRSALERGRPVGAGDRRALAESVRALLPKEVLGSTGTEIIRWYRDTNGGRDPDVFGG